MSSTANDHPRQAHSVLPCLRGMFVTSPSLSRLLFLSFFLHALQLAISQEVAENMSNQCREARVEVTALRRELEQSSRNKEESDKQIGDILEEKQHFEARMREMKEKLAKYVWMEKNEKEDYCTFQRIMV